MEFSQAHLFFWDKIERSNYFLNSIVSVFKRSPEETPDSRLASYLLNDPINDGGQWDMVCNVIVKHGVMPKQCFPDTVSCESSRNMNRILKSKLREFAKELYSAVSNHESDEDVQKRIKAHMSTVFRIVSICLGIPPESFTWQYYDKSKKACKIGPVSPLEFYNTYVKPHFNVMEKACLVTDPRPSNPTGKTYTVDCLGNVVGAKMTVYNNQKVDKLAELASKSIQAGEAVWFGCDVSKFFSRKKGFLDLDLFDFNLVFDTQVYVGGLNKADRMCYGDSLMNHAMLLTGVHIEDGEPTKWRIENSWGEDGSGKGYITMSNDWFKEFVFEVVVDVRFCSDEILETFKTTPIVLPAWDPMGALAKSCVCCGEDNDL